MLNKAIIFLIAATMAMTVAIMETLNYTRYILSDGTQIFLPDSQTLSILVNRDPQVLLEYLNNVTEIDRDQRARGVQRTHIVTAEQVAAPTDTEAYNHTIDDNSGSELTRGAERNLCYLKFFKEEGYVDWRTYLPTK
ncbi:hypothetical protein V1520DRAFT_351043 [Lipomyces starkeyi]